MRDWSKLIHARLSPLDVEVLRGLDILDRAVYANRPKPQGD